MYNLGIAVKCDEVLSQLLMPQRPVTAGTSPGGQQ